MLVGIHSPTSTEEIGPMNIIIDISHQRTARAVVAAAVMAAGALVPSAVSAGPVEEVEQACLADASGSADSLERWADHCGDVADEYRADYHECMRNAPGSADSLERWVDRCAADAAEDDDRR
jgi:hypothetical protein